jgi:hypothetical protein
MNSGNPQETHVNEVSDDLNFKRRRLIRGAIAVAPMVLTLRSGALAAASCTGALVLTQTSGSSGKLNYTGTEIKVDDKCVTYDPADQCLTEYPNNPRKIGSGLSSGVVSGEVSGGVGNWSCTGTNVPTQPGQPIAIMSANSLTSLLN